MTARTRLAAGLIAAAAAFAPFALLAPAASAQEHVFTLHHFLGPKATAHARMLEPWARRVEANAGGAVRIEIFPAMTLGGRPPELIGQARDGVVDLVWTLNGYTPGLFPRTEVMELPFVFVNDPVAANLALHEMFEDALRQDYRGVEVMFLHVHAGQAIHMRDAPVRSPADLAGKTLRIPSRTGAWIIEALGAAPVAMPAPDLPQALSKGVVDGAFIPWEIIPPLRIQEQTQYQIEGADAARFGTATFQLSMNQARWDALPAEIQKAFRDASGAHWRAEIGRIWRDADEAGIAVAVEAGNAHVVLTEDETDAFRRTLAPVVDRWIEEVSAKGIDGEALVTRARALIEKHAAR